MFRSAMLIALALFLTMALSACGPGATRLSKTDAGKTIELRAGDKLQVVLEGNPTTGYQWQVREVDAAVLKVSGEPEYKSESSLTGAGGQYTFHFESLAPGQTVLQLIYHRPFEKNVAPIETYQVTVVVK